MNVDKSEMRWKAEVWWDDDEWQLTVNMFLHWDWLKLLRKISHNNEGNKNSFSHFGGDSQRLFKTRNDVNEEIFEITACLYWQFNATAGYRRGESEVHERISNMEKYYRAL
jgi:hypothetical protein